MSKSFRYQPSAVFTQENYINTTFPSTCSFILYSMLRAIIVGFLQITSDYFIKPLLAVLFNGLCQPPLIFIRNMLQAICGMLDPVAKLLTTILHPITDVVRAFRVVEVKNINRLWQDPKEYQKLKVLQGQSSV